MGRMYAKTPRRLRSDATQQVLNCSCQSCNRPEHDILVLIAHAQKPRLNDHADISSGARGLNFGLSLHLHPEFVYASSGYSDEHARKRMLV